MTPDYIYNEMTWNEIGSALEYINRYDTTERHYKGVKLNDWMHRKTDTLIDDLKNVVKELRK